MKPEEFQAVGRSYEQMKALEYPPPSEGCSRILSPRECVLQHLAHRMDGKTYGENITLSYGELAWIRESYANHTANTKDQTAP